MHRVYSKVATENYVNQDQFAYVLFYEHMNKTILSGVVFIYNYYLCYYSALGNN